MPDPAISVIMPAFNAEKYIRPAIQSVLEQTYPNWQLIVVNDGSTDRTGEILSGYTDPRIKIFHQANGGEASARNTALQFVDTEFISFLDADDVFLPDHLSATMECLNAHPELDGVYTDGYYCNQEGSILKPLSSRRRGPFAGDIFEQMVRASDVFGAPVCVVLKRAPIEKYGLRFDPDIIIGPDWDFFTRFSENARFGSINQKTCLYRIHATNISTQTRLEKRILSLARCRERAIKLSRFPSCDVGIRRFVFYDLLINLLPGYPERQEEIVNQPEFLDLPGEYQGELFRLMASQEILRRGNPQVSWWWIRRAMAANPSDGRVKTLAFLFKIHPSIPYYFLSIRRRNPGYPPAAEPFADLLEK